MLRQIAFVAAAVVAVAVSASFLIACNAGDSDNRIVRTNKERPAALPNGRLKSQPSPLTLADVAKQPADSPQRAVLELLFYAQWGSLPNVVSAYSPAVLRRVRANDIAGAYAQQRPTLATSLPSIVETRNTKDGRFVAVRLTSTTGPPQLNAFVLRRFGDQWKVVYDSLLDSSLERFAQYQIDPSPAPSPDAIRRGISTATVFRGSARVEEKPSPGPFELGRQP
ncbi:MAG: hypothetical protein M3454_14555 [Actinomycetota bacterium]|nr:hypothetical protein [Actinomycetota bacterium]